MLTIKLNENTNSGMLYAIAYCEDPDIYSEDFWGWDTESDVGYELMEFGSLIQDADVFDSLEAAEDRADDVLSSIFENEVFIVGLDPYTPHNLTGFVKKIVRDSINESKSMDEVIKVGDKVKVSTPGNDYYNGRTGVVDYTEDGIVTVKFDDNNSPRLNNFDLNQVTKINESKSIKEDMTEYKGNSEECTFCGNECRVDKAEDTGTSLIFNCSNCGNKFEISKTVDIEKEFSNLAHVAFRDYLYRPIKSEQDFDDAVRLALTHDKYFSNRLSLLDRQQVVSRVSEMVKQLEYDRLRKLRNKPSSIVKNESKSINEDGLDDFGVSKSNADMLSTRLPDSKFYINDNKYVFGRDLVDYFDEDEIISYSQYINADNIRVPNSYKINGRTRTATESIKESPRWREIVSLNESKPIKEGTFHWSDNKAAYEAIKVKNALKKAFNTHVFQDDSQNLYIPFNFWGRKDAEKAGVTIDTVGKFLNSIGYKYTGKSEDDEDVYNYLKDDVKIELYEVDSNRYAIHLDFDSEVDDKLDIDTTSFSSYVNTDDVDAVQDLLLDIVERRVKTLGDISISEEDAKNIKKLCGGTLDMCTYDFAGSSDDIVDKVDDYFAMKQYQELHNKHVDESKSIKESTTGDYIEVAYICDGFTNFRVYGGGFKTSDALVAVEDEKGKRLRLTMGDVCEFYTWYDAKGNVIHEPGYIDTDTNYKGIKTITLNADAKGQKIVLTFDTFEDVYKHFENLYMNATDENYAEEILYSIMCSASANEYDYIDEDGFAVIEVDATGIFN